MTSQNMDVVCVGILVADIFAPPMAQLPKEGELLRVDDLPLSTGGCAANTGIDLVKLGAKVAVVGKVGNDVFADFIIQDLKSKGLDTSGVRSTAQAPTSRTVVLPVVGQDRRYIHAVGSNAELRVSDVDLELVKKARVLYVGGYLLFPGFDQESLLGLLKFARQNGVKTVLDIAGSGGHTLDDLRLVLPETDVFLPNEDEGFDLTAQEDPQVQAREFLNMGAATVIITMGEKGALAYSAQQKLHCPAYPIQVVDPSGGGDAFDAGFIVALLEGWNLAYSMRFASAVGASACMQLGTTTGVFTREETIHFMTQHPLDVVTL